MDLVKKLLDTSQLNRLTVQQALAHPWFGMDEGVFSCCVLPCCRALRSTRGLMSSCSTIVI
jgi:hypothetical protein